MRQANPTVLRVARHLLQHEVGGSQDAASFADATVRAYDKLRVHLTKLMGTDGFTLLLVRSLTFARADFPWVESITVERDGSLTGVSSAVGEISEREAETGFTGLLVHFIGLLIAFIGEDMTLRLIQGAWPEVDLGGRDLGMEETI